MTCLLRCTICFQFIFDISFGCPIFIYLFFVSFFFSLEGLTKHWLAVKIQVVLALLSVGVSVWLAYLLYFVIQNLCVVCVSLYVINIAIAVLAIIRHQKLRQTKPSSSSSASGTTQKKKAPARKGRSKKE